MMLIVLYVFPCFLLLMAQDKMSVMLLQILTATAAIPLWGKNKTSGPRYACF